MKCLMRSWPVTSLGAANLGFRSEKYGEKIRSKNTTNALRDSGPAPALARWSATPWSKRPMTLSWYFLTKRTIPRELRFPR
ncbi:MAG: hypothetical protein AMK69_26990 [Nitrospira bacterium SG8_3]|nr:MAG: hypothetical protein AMK69_26990 [Nitrospira bacterium SG8_3]